VISLNKALVTSADQALATYTSLRDAKKLDIELERRGKPVTIVITIQ
jgi:type II secretory pathway component PulC